jgi:hypothetical protein
VASTVAAARLTEQQRRDQVRVAKELIVSLRARWVLLNPADLDGSTATWLAFAVARLDAAHSESARIALAYLQGFRRLEVGAPLTAFEKITVPLRRPEAALYFTGPVKIKQGMTAGLTLVQASSRAFKELSRTAQMLALNGGRDTIKAGIRRDRKALGYQRVTDGSPCYFCALLASRGPVYRKDSFANARVHIGCGCTLEPVYSHDTEWVGRSREYAEIYANVSPGANQTVVAAFRQTYDSQR